MARTPVFSVPRVLPFPVGGIAKRTAFQTQSPWQCANAQNVIPDDPITGRERGGSRPGLTSYGTTANAKPTLMGEVRWLNGTTLTSTLLIAVNGHLYADNGSGTWTSVGNITTDRVMQGASFLQKYFLSSTTGLSVYDPVAATFGGVTGDNSLIEPTSLGAYSGGTVAIASGVVTLTPFSSSIDNIWPAWAALSGILRVGTLGAFTVATRTSNTVLHLNDTSVNVAAGTDMFLQSAGPVTYTDEGATAPAPPGNCYLVQRWANRIVLGGDKNNPLQVYLSGQGRYQDWRFGPYDDPSRAATLTAEPDGGQLGDILTALIPHNDECLIFGTRSGLSVLRGNPAAGGTVALLSESVGVLSGHSWCYDDEGFLWFLSNRGLYLMPPGCGSTPTAVSAEFLPVDLSGIDASAFECCLTYDSRFRGLHININDGSSPKNYFVATRTIMGGPSGGHGSSAFWPINYGTFVPYMCFARPHFVSGNTVSPVLLSGVDTGVGKVQFWDTAVACEGSSFVDYGPIVIGDESRQGILRSVDVTMAAGSDNTGLVSIAARGGDTAEGAVSASAFDSQTVSPGLNPSMLSRMGARGAVIRVAGQAGAKWSIEEMRIFVEPGMPLRYGT